MKNELLKNSELRPYAFRADSWCVIKNTIHLGEQVVDQRLSRKKPAVNSVPGLISTELLWRTFCLAVDSRSPKGLQNSVSKPFRVKKKEKLNTPVVKNDTGCQRSCYLLVISLLVISSAQTFMHICNVDLLAQCRHRANIPDTRHVKAQNTWYQKQRTRGARNNEHVILAIQSNSDYFRYCYTFHI